MSKRKYTFTLGTEGSLPPMRNPRKKQDRKRWGRKCPACGKKQKNAHLCSACYPIATHDNIQDNNPAKKEAALSYAEKAALNLPLFGD